MSRPRTPPTMVHQPCVWCDSSDAMSVWVGDDKDTGYCHSCGKSGVVEKKSDDERTKIPGRIFLTNDQKRGKITYSNTLRETFRSPMTVTSNYNKQYIDNYRGLTKDTLRFYGVVALVDEQGVPRQIEYPHGTEGSKIRYLEGSGKDFSIKGNTDAVPLFGMDKFPPGCAKAITITEGNEDAMSVYQMMGSKYPAVSVRSASQAVKDCKLAHKYINSFERIYLSFDDDGPGNEALRKVAALFDVNKVFIVEHGGGCKDANDYLTKARSQEYTKCWWNARTYKPKNIVNRNEEIQEILSRPSDSSFASFPFPGLEAKLLGIRTGRMYLFKAPRKVGKTEVFRAIEHHVLKTTPHNLGIIHLEESEKRAIQGLLTYELDTPVHRPECVLSDKEQYESYLKMVDSKDGRVNYYTHFATNDLEIILDAIRYMVQVQGCKAIFLDHITMLAAGNDEERTILDELSRQLAAMCRDLQFALFVISHVNDEGQTRGSRNIENMADVIIMLTRDNKSANDIERNTVNMMVEGERLFGDTGPCPPLFFDRNTYKLREMTVEDVSNTNPF